jgi:signal transduction histidine kinase
VLAVALVAGLFYYGEMGREAPRVILIVASALTVVSLVVAWANARYFADRIARLARATDQSSAGNGQTDEFDRIERAVGDLGSALSAAEAERALSKARAAEHLRDEATMVAGVVSDTLSQLDQVRLPLHILLDNRFGDLNENQEELLRDARTAADAMDVALRRLAQVADADRGALPVQLEMVQVNDVVRSVLPLARAGAERQGAHVETSLEPALPRVRADRARLAEALALLTMEAARETGPQAPLVISTVREASGAIIRLAPVVGGVPPTPEHATAPSPAGAGPLPAAIGASTAASILASRLIAAQGAELSIDGEVLTLRLRR